MMVSGFGDVSASQFVEVPWVEEPLEFNEMVEQLLQLSWNPSMIPEAVLSANGCVKGITSSVSSRISTISCSRVIRGIWASVMAGILNILFQGSVR